MALNKENYLEYLKSFTNGDEDLIRAYIYYANNYYRSEVIKVLGEAIDEEIYDATITVLTVENELDFLNYSPVEIAGMYQEIKKREISRQKV